ncbi:MAG: hypothetical protein NUV74_17160 [Candidatus Brocadiaceae bacterium]|nr:hypothetical protein [Candidatus Brocadiaceae bacterium]
MKDIANKNDVAVESFGTLAKKLEEHQKKLSVNRNYIKDGVVIGVNALEKIEKLKNKHIINVNLEIPKKIYEELRDGKVVRVGGALKHPTKNVFRKHLKEIKPSAVRKLTKATNMVFFVTDVFESVLVDQKLRDIMNTVKEIDLKLEAQNRGAFLSAIEQSRELYLIQNEEIKRQKIILVLDKLSYCEHLFTVIYENKWKEYIKLDNSYKNDFKSRLTNTSELKKMCEIGKALPEYLEIIALCKIAQVRLWEMLGQYVLAKEKAFNLVSFLSEKIDNYKDNFGDYALSIKLGSHSRLFGEFWDMCTWDAGGLHREKRLKNIKDGFIESHERIEFLLNTALCVPLDVPEELSNDL